MIAEEALEWVTTLVDPEQPPLDAPPVQTYEILLTVQVFASGIGAAIIGPPPWRRPRCWGEQAE